MPSIAIRNIICYESDILCSPRHTVSQIYKLSLPRLSILKSQKKEKQKNAIRNNTTGSEHYAKIQASSSNNQEKGDLNLLKAVAEFKNLTSNHHFIHGQTKGAPHTSDQIQNIKLEHSEAIEAIVAKFNQGPVFVLLVDLDLDLGSWHDLVWSPATNANQASLSKLTTNVHGNKVEWGTRHNGAVGGWIADGGIWRAWGSVCGVNEGWLKYGEV